MNEELVKFNEYLTFLSEKLQKPVEFVYDLLLRQVYFEGVLSFFGLIVGLVMLLFGAKAWRWAKEYMDENIYDLDILPFIPFVILTLMGSIVTVTHIIDLLQIIINPHWYMIKLAADLVK